MALPENCTDRVIAFCHSGLFGGHQGVIKTYLAMNEKIFMPDLIHLLMAYVKRHLIFQLHRNEKPQPRQLPHRINLNFKAMNRLNIDLKVMPRSYKGHKFILVASDETNL